MRVVFAHVHEAEEMHLLSENFSVPECKYINSQTFN